MTINGKLTLASAPWETDRRSAPIGLPLRASTHQGPDFVIGINHRYLSEAIGEAGIRSVRFHDDGSPIVISDQDDERLAVVMPIKL